MPPHNYCPAALRLSSSTNDDSPISCSAIFLAFSDSPNQSLLISTSPVLHNVPSTVEIHVTCPQLISNNTVIWHRARIISSSSLDGINSFLRPFQQYRTLPIGSENASVTVLASDLCSKITKWNPLTMLFRETDFHVGSSVTVHSSSFVLVNPALFCGFVSTGTLGYRSQSALLCDIRYLDGMDGGIVMLGNDQNSIGMVCGGLVKKGPSKDDDGGSSGVLLVASWIDITRSLVNLSLPDISRRLSPSLSSNQGQLDAEISSIEAPITACCTVHLSVVYLVVSTTRRNVTSWGSGIIIRPGIIVTNAHVIEKYRSITIYLRSRDGDPISVQAEVLGEPIRGIDMVFLKYDDSNIGSKSIEISTEPVHTGLTVQSVGYGVFYPGRRSQRDQASMPMISEGIVSSSVSMSINEDHATAPILYVCSCKCWNGSSGGAVIEKKTGKLVGMMNSNGKHMATGKQIPEMAFVIPIGIIEYGLELALKGEIIEADARVHDLWMLNSTHREIKL